MAKRNEMRRVVSRRRWTEEDALQILEAWKTSGKTLSVFARELGVGRQRIQRWVAQLGIDEPEPSVTFHPVRVIGESRLPEAEALEVVLVDGTRVRIPNGFDAEELRRLIGVLREKPAC